MYLLNYFMSLKLIMVIIIPLSIYYPWKDKKEDLEIKKVDPDIFLTPFHRHHNYMGRIYYRLLQLHLFFIPFLIFLCVYIFL